MVDMINGMLYGMIYGIERYFPLVIYQFTNWKTTMIKLGGPSIAH
jgi:hypothetical protein